MDTARHILSMLARRMRAAAQAVARAKRENYPETTLLVFEAQLIEAGASFQVARGMYHLIHGDVFVRNVRSQIISTSQARDEFVTLDDGYIYFLPHGSVGGALSAWHLRVIADELDRRNKPKDAKLRSRLLKRS